MALVDCTVRVNGAVFNDGCNPALEDEPAIISALNVVWGRATTLDQPEPSTCKFTVTDPTATSESLSALVVGAPIDVDASGVLYDPSDLSTFVTPDLSNPAAYSIRGGTVTPASPGIDVDYLPRTTAQWEMVLYPAPPSTDPAAWDLIPTTSSGQTWQARITLTVPPGMAVRVTPVLFNSATGANPIPLNDQMHVYAPPPYAATLHTFDIDIADDGFWIGFHIASGPTYQWATVGTVTWAGAATWPGSNAAPTWQALSRVRVANADVLSPSTGTTRTVRVFSGRITDMTATYDDSVPGLAIEVTATDFTADLDNRRVGDEPWLAEPYADRFARVLALAAPTMTATIEPGLDYVVSWVDVDNQPARSLLQDLTTTVDGVLWSATHTDTGPYLLAENPANRPSGRALVEQSGVVVIVVDSASIVDALPVSSCDVLRDPVQWVQDVTDVVTRVAVTWQEQGTPGPDMDTTERHETYVDDTAELIYGTRAVSVSTDLTNALDALAIGQQIQARTSGLGWRMNGLVIDAEQVENPDRAAVSMVCELLDGTTRIGRLVLLENVPGWVPANIGDGNDIPVYVEGGEYAYTAGGWVLGLIASSARATGISATWEELDPDWSWEMFDPSITWAGMRGAIVGAGSTASYPGLIYPGTAYPGVNVIAAGFDWTGLRRKWRWSRFDPAITWRAMSKWLD
jgi:hypothetical protein